ncbi:MAG: efflux RND transporter periplasmic adaptor subunit [Bacteroidaceae bacterium]|nr:efflux RND transporter periplasmic adaptor subunit [Bacteroidaceae bacterium]
MKTINFFVLTLTAAGLLTACGVNEKKNAETKIRNVMTVQPLNRQETTVKNFSGVVKENSTVSLSFRTPGQIMHILVKEGTHVRKGQLVATLDTKDYQLQVDAAQTQYDQLKNEVERLRKLHETNSLSGNDFEKATSGLEQRRIQLQNAKNQLSYTRLTAPVDGTVQKVNFEPSEMVSAGMPVMDIVDTHGLEVEVNIPDDVYRFLSSTTEAYCIAAGERYNLHKKSVLAKADANQLFTVKYAIDGQLNPGVNVDVYIEMGGDMTVSGLSIPAHAIFEEGGKTYVWVVEQGNIVKRHAITAHKVDSEGMAVVESGISATDQVVKAGVKALHDGDKVKIVAQHSTNVGDLL